ncbi:MAG: hypothetical protein AAFR17_03185 [Pseudomonadota bacterium]
MVRFLILIAALAGCAYTPAPEKTQPGSSVGGTGGIQYTLTSLGASKNMLTVTAAPGLLETDGSIAQRIIIFANQFSAEHCGGAYQFVSDPNFYQPPAAGFMRRVRSFVFE